MKTFLLDDDARTSPPVEWAFALVTVACWAIGCDGGIPTPGWTPPGAAPYVRELEKEITKALVAKGDDYVPRTRHLREDGAPRYTNRLIFESSPYLQQHAHNPVNWYPWGDEAFETARRLGRPVLLSIGYSTCHWCHVMEEESFEDEEIAAYLNANYVAIKVDREERPDVDSVYMAAVSELTGRGGWPMTTWLTPDRQPFFGGTYFPPREDSQRRRGFLPLLQELKQRYDQSPDQIALEARRLSMKLRRRLKSQQGRRLADIAVVDALMDSYRRGFDKVHGGLGGGRKFPSSFPVSLTLRTYRRTSQVDLLEMATLTLDKMARGGIHDQVGGGFHRYTVEPRWLVPHFEKMLYDNALLTRAYLDGYQVTGRPEYADVARKTLAYVAREMTSPEGAFYSATDADSLNPAGHREEGWFFTWTPKEIRAVLGPEDARIVEAFFGVTSRGNFENRNILHQPMTLNQTAAAVGVPPAELGKRIDAARGKLYEARLERPPPLRDDKILTSWNGLMISAMARGAFVLNEPRFADRAERAAGFLLDKLRKDGRLLRSYKDGRARFNAYVDDYAFLIAGLLDLYEATSNLDWLREAMALQRTLDDNYMDDKTGSYFLTSHDHEALLARERPIRDGAEPSGNSVAAMNLLRLHEFTLKSGYRAAAERLLTTFGPKLSGSSEMLMALDFYADTAREIVIVTDGPRSDAEPLLAVLRETFLPNKVLASVRQGRELDALAELMPMVERKTARGGKATAYVCQQGSCKLPTTDPEVLASQLRSPSAGVPRSF